MSFLSDVIQILKASGGIDNMKKEAMNCHASCYRDNLHHCNDAMLQYEWAWLEEHVQALRRSQLQPEVMTSLGGVENVKILISECVLFQLILQEEFGRRHLSPLGSHASIVPSEEAWEITSLKVKQDWGIVPA
jgi:hypothetical protein